MTPYIIQRLTTNPAIANQIAVALTGNPSDAETFTEESAVVFSDGAMGVEVIAGQSDYDKARDFEQGINSIGVPEQEFAAARAAMTVRTGDRSIQGTFREWAAEQGHTANE